MLWHFNLCVLSPLGDKPDGNWMDEAPPRRRLQGSRALIHRPQPNAHWCNLQHHWSRSGDHQPRPSLPPEGNVWESRYVCTISVYSLVNIYIYTYYKLKWMGRFVNNLRSRRSWIDCLCDFFYYGNCSQISHAVQQHVVWVSTVSCYTFTVTVLVYSETWLRQPPVGQF